MTTKKQPPLDNLIYKISRSLTCFYTQHLLGRWITMDAGDLDNGEDIDIALGSYTLGPDFRQSLSTWRKHSGGLLLENTLRHD